MKRWYSRASVILASCMRGYFQILSTVSMPPYSRIIFLLRHHTGKHSQHKKHSRELRKAETCQAKLGSAWSLIRRMHRKREARANTGADAVAEGGPAMLRPCGRLRRPIQEALRQELLRVLHRHLKFSVHNLLQARLVVSVLRGKAASSRRGKGALLLRRQLCSLVEPFWHVDHPEEQQSTFTGATEKGKQ